MSQRFLALLNEAYSERKKRTPGYSIRAFAKLLGMDSGTLSRLMTGKREPSPAVVKKLSQKIESLKQGDLPDSHAEQKELTLEDHLLLDKWYVSALQELTYLSGFQSDPVWIANQLGVSTKKIEEAIDLLLRIGYLARRADGRLYDPVGPTFTPRYEDHPLAQEGNRINHAELNQISEERYRNDSSDLRSHSHYIVAGDRKKMIKLKKLTAQYRKEAAAILSENSSDPTDVFIVKIDCFRLNRLDTSKK